MKGVSVAGFFVAGLGSAMFIAGLNDKLITGRGMRKLLSMNRHATDEEKQQLSEELERSSAKLIRVGLWATLVGLSVWMGAYMIYAKLH